MCVSLNSAFTHFTALNPAVVHLSRTESDGFVSTCSAPIQNTNILKGDRVLPTVNSHPFASPPAASCANVSIASPVRYIKQINRSLNVANSVKHIW